jgi:RNase H-fold protein (predicted Holliday junction resolvase)
MRRKSAPQILSLLQEDDKFSDVSIKEIIDVIKSHIQSVEKFAIDNPKYLDNKLQLTVRHIESLDRLLKEQWALYERLTDENPKSKNQALASIKNIVMDQARLQQLLSNDRDIQKRLEEMKEANHKLIIMFKNITKDCEHCTERLNKEIAKRINVIEV